MTLVADLVEPQVVRRWTNTETFTLGEEDVDAGRVILLVCGPRAVTALVGGKSLETVEMSSTPDGLQWSCTCSDDKQRQGCRHFVAVALETWRQSSASMR